MPVVVKMSVNSQSISDAGGCDPQVRDERLVAAAKAGDVVAFDQLCEHHFQKVFRVTHRITRNRGGCRGRGPGILSQSFHAPEEFRRKVAIFNLAHPHRHECRADGSAKKTRFA